MRVEVLFSKFPSARVLMRCLHLPWLFQARGIPECSFSHWNLELICLQRTPATKCGRSAVFRMPRSGKRNGRAAWLVPPTCERWLVKLSCRAPLLGRRCVSHRHTRFFAVPSRSSHRLRRRSCRRHTPCRSCKGGAWPDDLVFARRCDLEPLASGS